VNPLALSVAVLKTVYFGLNGKARLYGIVFPLDWKLGEYAMVAYSSM
jgi:hypothetical protein